MAQKFGNDRLRRRAPGSLKGFRLLLFLAAASCLDGVCASWNIILPTSSLLALPETVMFMLILLLVVPQPPLRFCPGRRTEGKE
ncbi:hypothetical protein [Bradyrhizobium sp. DASA03120]|uniref:hypothetical protein n=1 Tax=Bradyrhizobium sp. SMVTL-02 TaxID=3395917 RepID=UPI003F6F8E94